MKIIGFIGIDGAVEMILKGDSCLLNNRKPFFLPADKESIHITPCIVLRISRLGKHIAPKFAHRYYDAIANGADFADAQRLAEARKNGHAWTEALAFDYSLAIGEMQPIVQTVTERPDNACLLISEADAIARASELMTIRQGDLIYIQLAEGSRRVLREEVIEAPGLYCKVK